MDPISPLLRAEDIALHRNISISRSRRKSA
jgi:hypothetical protein